MSRMRYAGEDLQVLRHHMHQLAQEANAATPRLWVPAVDVSENEHEIVLQAELPGMKKEDIDLQLTGDTVTLRGERKLESAQRGEQYHRLERQYGAWQRTFQIEVPLDAQGVTAHYKHGVLTVHLPRQEAAKPRQIAIDAP